MELPALETLYKVVLYDYIEQNFAFSHFLDNFVHFMTPT